MRRYRLPTSRRLVDRSSIGSRSTPSLHSALLVSIGVSDCKPERRKNSWFETYRAVNGRQPKEEPNRRLILATSCTLSTWPCVRSKSLGSTPIDRTHSQEPSGASKRIQPCGALSR